MTPQYTTLQRENGDVITFDAVLTAQFSGQAAASRYPKETGARGIDHTQADPRKVTLNVRQTEDPIGGFTGGAERVRELMRILEEIGRKGERIAVSIPRIGLFDDYILLSWPNTIDLNRSSDFNIVIERFEIAETQIVFVPIEFIAPPARAGQQTAADLGTQATDEAPPEAVTAPENANKTPPSLLSQLRARL